ncbi:MAG TPA: ABC transporter permease subunit [Streptosporangiaceae bacterium]|nr:ABC transporter permease subunit [Streptosporangiaceae bacterium]
MTAAQAGTAGALPASHSQPKRASFGQLMLSEWTKIRSVRSTVWSLILFVIVSIGFTVLFTALTAANWSQAGADTRARIVTDPVSFIMGAGLGLGQLTLCVLGALVITTEYSTGVIRSSLLAVPHRVPMLAAKAVVFAVLILIVAEVVCFGMFLTGSAILHSHAPVSLGDPNVTRAVVGSGLYLTVVALLALAIGGIIRHTAGAISTVIGVILVLPILTGLLPGSWGKHIDAYLPEQAGTLIGQAHHQSGDLLSAWQGFGVLCIWAAVLLAVTVVLLKRRDA